MKKTMNLITIFHGLKIKGMDNFLNLKKFLNFNGDNPFEFTNFKDCFAFVLRFLLETWLFKISVSFAFSPLIEYL